jgi:hypothetical protein
MSKHQGAWLAIVACVGLSACGGGSAATTPPVGIVPGPGTFGVVAVEKYQGARNSFIALSDLNYMLLSQAHLIQDLQNHQWIAPIQYQNASATVSNTFGSTPQSSTDLMVMFGHGLAGMFVFGDGSRWGPGTTSGNVYYSAGQSRYIPGNVQNMPVQGKLKWIVGFTSNTVAGPPGSDSSSDASLWTTNWSPAFGLSLHGIYGFWSHPNSHCGGMSETRSCDLNTFQDVPMADAFAANAQNQLSVMTIHDSWVAAANDAHIQASDEWSIWEDAANRDDVLTGYSGNSAPINQRNFYNVQSSAGTSTPVFVGRETFSLHPTDLVNEYVDEGGGFSRVRSSYDPNASSSDDGTVFKVRNGGYEIAHYRGTTGAITMHAFMYDNPMAFTMTDAQNTAINYINQSLGFPANNTLSESNTIWKYSTSSGSNVPVGYEFIWRPTNGIHGSDAIKVIVTDKQTMSRVCIRDNTNDPPHNIPACYAWQTTYSDAPYVSYSFRLWRTTGNTRQILSTGQPATGQPSIDAYTASLSLPAGYQITGYTSGYWTGSALDPNSSVNGAIPAWIFSSGSANYAIGVAPVWTGHAA